MGQREWKKCLGNFFDLHIEMKKSKSQIGCYDKRDSFLFSVARMPANSSNIP